MDDWMFTLYWWPDGADWNGGRDVSYAIKATSIEEAAEAIYRDWHGGAWQSATLWTERGVFEIDLNASSPNHSRQLT